MSGVCVPSDSGVWLQSTWLEGESARTEDDDLAQAKVCRVKQGQKIAFLGIVVILSAWPWTDPMLGCDFM